MADVLDSDGGGDRVIEQLARELEAVGIRGRLRRRILTEATDHLGSDPDAIERFGEPSAIANAFAADLGTRASRRATFAAFVTLAFAGLVYATVFIGAAVTSTSSRMSTPPMLASLVMVVAPQVSFVTGSLACLRALRLRRLRHLPTGELTAINRRAGVALVSGLATLAGVLGYSLGQRSDLPSWLVTAAVAGALVAAVPLVCVLMLVRRAGQLQPRVEGPVGDLFDDLGITRISPWRLALAVAGLVGAIVWAQAALRGDPYDGLVIGIGETLACLAGFTLLGKYLALRR